MKEDFLKEMSENKGFGVPDDYFQTLEKRLISKSVKKPNQKRKLQVLSPYLSVAASFLFLVFLWKIVLLPQIDKHKFAEQSKQLDYLELQVSQMDEALIIDAYNSEAEFAKLSDEEIINYLSEEDITALIKDF